MKNLILLFLILLFSTFGLKSQSTKLLNREQKVALMDKIDSLIYTYEEAHFFVSKVPKIFNDRKKTFLQIFASGIEIPLDMFPSYNSEDSLEFCLNYVTPSFYFNSIQDLAEKEKIKRFSAGLASSLDSYNLRFDGTNYYTSITLNKEYAVGEGNNYSSEVEIVIVFDIVYNDIVDAKIHEIKVNKSQSSIEKRRSLPKIGISYIPTAIEPKRPSISEGYIGNSISSSGLTLELEAKYELNKMLRLLKFPSVSIGLSIGLNTGEWVIQSDTVSILTVDIDNESYFRNIYARDLVDRYFLISLGLPIEFKMPDKLLSGFPIKPYAKVTPQYLIISDFKGTGNFTFTGFYPQYNVTLTDIVEYDFGDSHVSDQSYDQDYEDLQLRYEIGISINPLVKLKSAQLGLELFYNYQKLNFRQSNSSYISIGTENYVGIGGYAREQSINSFGARLTILMKDKILRIISNGRCE